MNNITSEILDVVGIGFGPANIALAIAAEELQPGLRIGFLEKNAGAGWQEDMLLPESDIQNHPLRDLVTPRNPRSRYSFVNFLFENGRLYEHLNLPLAHPLRVEYRQYVAWVASHFAGQVRYGSGVTEIMPVLEQGTISHYAIACADGHRTRARAVVVAPGRTPHVPPAFAALGDQRVVHFTQFLRAYTELRERVPHPRIAVVGGSQTAVELLLHIAADGGAAELTGINRNFGFRLKDTSPFSDEVYFPAFVETFFHATPEHKDRLRQELRFTNYSASDGDVLNALYVQLYRNKILGKDGLAVKHLTNISAVHADADAIHLTLEHSINGGKERQAFDLVILATGFRDLGTGPGEEAYPALLAGMAPHLDLARGALDVELDYRVRLAGEGRTRHAPLYLNGLCESSHGMGDAGSFSLLSLRSAAILNSLSNRLSPASAAGGHTSVPARQPAVDEFQAIA